MYVKLVISADKKRYSALLISGKYKKRVYGISKTGAELKNILIGLIKTIKKIKYPVEIEIINNRSEIKKILDKGLELNQNRKFVIENKELWKELSFLLNQHISYNFSYNTERQKNDKIFNELYRDCIYKRF